MNGYERKMLVSELVNGEWQPVAVVPVYLEDWMEDTWESLCADDTLVDWQGGKAGVYGWRWIDATEVVEDE